MVGILNSRDVEDENGSHWMTLHGETVEKEDLKGVSVVIRHRLG